MFFRHLDASTVTIRYTRYMNYIYVQYIDHITNRPILHKIFWGGGEIV